MSGRRAFFCLFSLSGMSKSSRREPLSSVASRVVSARCPSVDASFETTMPRSFDRLNPLLIRDARPARTSDAGRDGRPRAPVRADALFLRLHRRRAHPPTPSAALSPRISALSP